MIIIDSEDETYVIEGLKSRCPLCGEDRLIDAEDDMLVCPDGCGEYFRIVE